MSPSFSLNNSLRKSDVIWVQGLLEVQVQLHGIEDMKFGFVLLAGRLPVIPCRKKDPIFPPNEKVKGRSAPLIIREIDNKLQRLPLKHFPSSGPSRAKR